MGVFFFWCGNSKGAFSLFDNKLIGWEFWDEERIIQSNAKE